MRTSIPTPPRQDPERSVATASAAVSWSVSWNRNTRHKFSEDHVDASCAEDEAEEDDAEEDDA
jgi:hypothetical protein